MIVKINGIKFDFQITEVQPSAAEVASGKIKYGYCSHPESIIRINKELGTEQQYFSFIHECLHALIAESCAGQFITPENDERFIQAMEAPLASFIRDNWKLIKKLGGLK